jgi:uncharacterized membrane protein
MLEKVRLWSEVLLLACISACALIAVLLFIRATSTILWSEEAAGWMQAIGSVIAIVVAWMAVSYQLNHGERNKEKENRKTDLIHLEIGLRLAKDVYGIHMDVHRKYVMNRTLFAGHEKKLSTIRIEEMQTSLHNFTLRPIDPVLYAEVLTLIRELAYTLTAVREQNAKTYTSSKRVKRAFTRANTMLKCRDRIQKMLDAASTE